VTQEINAEAVSVRRKSFFGSGTAFATNCASGMCGGPFGGHPATHPLAAFNSFLIKKRLKGFRFDLSAS